MLRENKRYNRSESDREHFYNQQFGTIPLQNNYYEGFIKCKLIHGLDYSLVVPDQIYITASGLVWIQPLSFLPNICVKTNLFTECQLYIDISCGHTIKVVFRGEDIVRVFNDGSNYFKCEIQGPELLSEYATGTAELKDGKTFLHLYHHTSIESKQAIENSRFFLTSKLNFQGTTKRLKNISYTYFTCLDRIEKEADLIEIAMASSKEITLIRDDFNVPMLLPPNWRELYKDDILVLEVYPSTPDKRKAALRMSIDSTILASQYLLRHEFTGQGVYYQICNPFINRIGAEPNSKIQFDEKYKIQRQTSCKMFDYIVVGDARTLPGLAAPYNEEDTTDIMKIERVAKGSNLIDFWFEHANNDLYSSKKIDLQEFES